MSSGLTHFKRRLLPRFLSPFCAYEGDFSLFCIHKDMISISRVYALPFIVPILARSGKKCDQLSESERINSSLPSACVARAAAVSGSESSSSASAPAFLSIAASILTPAKVSSFPC